MQSFLQYRRFRTAAKAQIERDRARQRGLGSYNRPRDTDEDHSPSSATSDESKVDLEKGPGFLGPSRPDQAPNGVRSGDVDVRRKSEPLPEEEEEEEEEEEAMRENQRSEIHEPVEEKSEEEHEDDEDDLELSENVRNTLSRTTTQQSTGTALGKVLTGIDVRRRTTNEGGDGNVFVVGYEGEDDPNDPHNWSLWVRIRCTLIIASIGLVVGLASAIDSPAIPEAAKEFGVSEVTESLATGVFLIGFGAGALFAGPISETVGRNPVYIGTLGLYMIFIMASALAPNIGAQLAFRFIAGFFGSTPLTCAGGSISDIWSPLERVITFPIFANAAFTGPLFGPVMGGFIASSSAVSWRWVEWTTLIFSGLVLILVILFQPETFPPILLKWKAKTHPRPDW